MALVKKYFKDNYGDDLRKVKKYKHPLFKKYLPEFGIFAVDMFNKASMLAGREILTYAAAVDNQGGLTVLMNMDECAAFIENNVKKAATDDEALDLARLLAWFRQSRPRGCSMPWPRRSPRLACALPSRASDYTPRDVALDMPTQCDHA
jgi:hypothetical protein